MNMNKKKENVKMLSSFEEDNVWMSYRYCIGRHTIAAHMHASDIAENVYGRLSEERTQFMSEDINNEIHTCLHTHNFINMGWYGNIPKSHFKPLDVVYSILNKESIDSSEKVRQIKEIRIDWNRDKNDFDYSIYYFNDNDKDKDLGRSLWDITDLEVWQQLANLFDLKGHKWCKLIDGTLCEYYECWEHYNTEDKNIKFRKKKHPVDRYNSFNTYIPEENILEDNVEPNKQTIMTIETKYNIGDEVFFKTLGITYKAKVVAIELHAYIDGDVFVEYKLERKGYYYERNEDELFPTKEELLKSL